MTNVVNRITSYDFLGMFIPGSVGLAMIVAKWFPNLLIEKPTIVCYGCKVMSENTTLMTIMQMLVFFAGAYVLGLFINCISDIIWRGFRNNDVFIEMQAQKLIQRSSEYKWIEKAFNVAPSSSLYWCYWIKNSLVGCLNIIWYSIKHFLRPADSYPSVEKHYYDAYYWLLGQDKISSVSIMESQVTLLRNLLLPLCFGFPLVSFLHIEWWQQLLLWLSVFFTMVSRQNRIYAVILEDYQNYKEMEVNHEANSNNHN